MNYRMSNYGSRIISPQKSTEDYRYNPSYFSPSPVKSTYMGSPPVYYSPQKSKFSLELKEVKNEIDKKNEAFKKRKLLGSLVSLTNSLEARQKKTEFPQPSSPEKPDVIPAVLTSMQKQQEMMMQMIQSLNERKQTPKHSWHPEMHYANPLEMPAQHLRRDPQEFKRVLAELDFDDEEAQNYADEEKKYRYDPEMSEKEKAQIMKQILEDKKQREKQRRVEAPKTRGIKLFRIAGICAIFPFLVQKSIVERRSRIKNESIKNMEDSIKIYKEAAKTWAIKAIRSPLLSLINEGEQDLSLTTKEKLDSSAFQAKILKVQVRVKGVIEGLVSITNDKEMPVPLRLFLNKLVNNGAFFPENYLVSFESSRIELDEFGALIRQTNDRKRLLAGFFLVTRVVVDGFCLNPQEQGLPVKKNSKVYNNLKTIGSVLQMILLLSFAKTSRMPHEGIEDENEVMLRRKGQKLGPVIFT